MINRRLLDSITLVLLLTLAVMAWLAWAEPPQRLPLVKADWPVCVRVRPAPLIDPRHPVTGNRLSETV